MYRYQSTAAFVSREEKITVHLNHSVNCIIIYGCIYIIIFVFKFEYKFPES